MDLLTLNSVESGNLEMIKLLLKNGVDPNPEVKKGLVPLHIAAQKGYLGIVYLLLTHGVNVDFACVVEADDSYTSLYIASYFGNKLIVKTLLKEGADPNVCFKKRLTPLHAAAQQGYKQIVKLLLQYGAEVNPTHHPDEVFSTPLLAAAQGGYHEIVEMLLKHGANPNVMLLSPFSNFSIGIEYMCNEEKFKHCLYEEHESEFKFTPLHYAALSGNENLVKMILKHEVSLDALSGNEKTPVSIAIDEGNKVIVDILLKAGAKTNADDQEKYNFLFNYTTIFRSCRLDPRLFSDRKKLSPFFYSVVYRNVETLEALLNNGLRFEMSTIKNEPLVHFAIEKRVNQKMLKFLLKRGADLNARNPSGLTPLHSLLQVNQFECTDQLKTILEFEPVVDVHTKMAKLSEIHMAVVHEKLEEIKLLLGYGVDICCLDMEEETPYTVAVKILISLRNNYNSDDSDYPDDFESRQDASPSLDLECNLDSSDWNQYFCHKNNRDPGTFISIVRILTSELVRLEAGRRKIEDQDSKWLKKEFMKPYYERCKDEIERMEQCEIADRISYFDVLIADKRRITFYARNKKLRDTLQNRKHFQLFPMYGEMLEARFENKRQKMILLELSAESLEKAFPLRISRKNCRIPILIATEILSYLKIADLMNLCEAAGYH